MVSPVPSPLRLRLLAVKSAIARGSNPLRPRLVVVASTSALARFTFVGSSYLVPHSSSRRPLYVAQLHHYSACDRVIPSRPARGDASTRGAAAARGAGWAIEIEQEGRYDLDLR
ncbi:hypothetical protein PR202_gb29426 [Eleusine coracana subsp. coracana]|uniref:Uncharacterized protein n=1 Tax=Eleusine coracana subsp. coracana TaxID=191504 RepID=A0AAV5FYY7_ELECO|nr:hypothetical protein PR202_gb29426 [Eleusine coracana subsp. coracana]